MARPSASALRHATPKAATITNPDARLPIPRRAQAGATFRMIGEAVGRYAVRRALQAAQEALPQ